MDNSLDEKETEDPDYESVSSERKREQRFLNTRQQDAKEQAIQRIDHIIRQQFGFEVHLKEREIDLIDNRVSQAKAMLDRLRSCVLAKYYGTSGQKAVKGTRTNDKLGHCDRKKSARNCVKRVEFPRTGVPNHSNEMASATGSIQFKTETTKSSAVTDTLTNNGYLVDSQLQSKKTLGSGNANAVIQSDSSSFMSEEQLKLNGNLLRGSSENSKPAVAHHTKKEQVNQSSQSNDGISNNFFRHSLNEKYSPSTAGNPSSAVGNLSNAVGSPLSAVEKLSSTTSCTGSRFYIKKRIIVGNTSKYISIDRREENDKSTHKWMVYVRGPREDPNIDRFISKVWFFLHPSYRPNDIVEVNKPPFHLTRRGWGEFPVRVQLHFVDPRNKRVDIIHELKLDRTYTGLQTLGSETVVDLELDRRTFEDNCVPLGTLSGKEDRLSSNATDGDRGNDDNNVERKTVSILYYQQNQLVADTLFKVRKCPANSENSSQCPQLKKLKLESPFSVGSSAFSSTVSTPVNSQPASRCSSPELTSSHLHVESKFPDEVNDMLRKAVNEHPLIDPERNVVKHHYCASSIEQFLGWNIGKRRACEWQRSVAIRRRMLSCMPSCNLSTKDILLWCRRFGYTPCDKVTGDEKVLFCKLCGGFLSVPFDETSKEKEAHKCEDPLFNSLTPASELISDVEVKERCLPDVPKPVNDSEDLEIDVVGLTPKERIAEPQESKPVIYSIPSTPEQNWIRETCSDIGVKLKTVNTDGLDVHVIENLLLAAGKGFAEDILRQSWAIAADQTTSHGPRLVTPSHVHKAVCSLPHCDFLTRAYLGEILHKEEK